MGSKTWNAELRPGSRNTKFFYNTHEITTDNRKKRISEALQNISPEMLLNGVRKDTFLFRIW